MKLINAEKLIQDLNAALAEVEDDHPLPKMVAEAIRVMINRQPEIRIPEMRGADPHDVPSGYWFDKGWDAYREEFLNGN